ncbi:fluoride efflux transporter FluC [Salinarchaeum laminariae]|uniref:fluoride efflux transporter FluC n=1 Tax=Salinarchaeum laminariae TaxID=869888 RepID=UPI0020C064C4|nr:CrcB family protein [Salinarchaeum laminariae]
MPDRRRPVPSGVLVATGGFTGAIARFLVDEAMGASLQSTLLVNVVGSFALALLLARLLNPSGSELPTGRRRLQRFGATGFLSSFTTYSTFVVGTLKQEPAVAVGYVLATYAAGFAAAGLGLAAGRWRGERR